MKRSLSSPARRLTLGLVVALVGLSVVAAGASASIWHVAGAGDAVAAKKKCKKKKHRSASDAKKKKKCKHKKKHTAPPPTPARGPIVRIDVSWTADAEVDAHAWSNGAHDGWSQPLDNYETGIPGTTFETSSSRERVTELNPNPVISPMTFGICYFPELDGDAGPIQITATTVFSDGVSHTETIDADFGDAFVADPQEGGPPADLEDWCPQA